MTKTIDVEFSYFASLTDEEIEKINKLDLFFDDDGISIFLGNSVGLSQTQMLKLFEEEIVGKEKFKKHFGRILPPRQPLT